MQEEGVAPKEDNVLRVLGLQAARNTAPVRKFAPKQRPASKHAANPAADAKTGRQREAKSGSSTSSATTAAENQQIEDESGIPTSDSVTITISSGSTQDFRGMDTLIEAIRFAPKTPNLFAKQQPEDAEALPPSAAGRKRPRNGGSVALKEPKTRGTEMAATTTTAAAGMVVTRTRARTKRSPRKQAALLKVAQFINSIPPVVKDVSDGSNSPSTVIGDVSDWYNSQILPQSFGSLPFECFNIYLNKGDEGLGLRLRDVDGKAVVVAVTRQDGVNVRSHDVIVAVDEVDASEASFDKLIQKLRSAQGLVCLRIARPTHPPVGV